MIAPVVNIATARKPAPINPADLLTRLRLADGLRVYLKDGALFVGPATALTAEQRKLIRDHRDAMVRELIAEKDADLDYAMKHCAGLRRELQASEDQRKHAETLLELTRIQLGLEREYGSMRRPPPDLPPIPEAIRRYVASRIHPDHNGDSPIATQAMAWLNAQPREVRP